MSLPHSHDTRKVSFLIAGTQKGGTSALDAYLREHPEICMATRKEVHFFDDDGFFSKGAPDYSSYHSFFPGNAPGRLMGEATPIYMYWNDAPRRIWQYNSEMKILIILRNPIERAFSHWNMERHRKKETLSFFESIKSESDRCRTALPYQHRVYSYVDRGFYVEQLRRIWNFFPKGQTLILRNEELKHDPRSMLCRIYRFLGVADKIEMQEKSIHATPYFSTMTLEEWKYLMQVYEYEIRALERLLGWDCHAWLKRPQSA